MLALESNGRARVLNADQRTSTPAAFRWHVSRNRLTLKLPAELDEPSLWNDIKNDAQLLYSKVTRSGLPEGAFTVFELIAIGPDEIKLQQSGLDFPVTWTRVADRPDE